jgi:hypothetical protein
VGCRPFGHGTADPFACQRGLLHAAIGHEHQEVLAAVAVDALDFASRLAQARCDFARAPRPEQSLGMWSSGLRDVTPGPCEPTARVRRGHSRLLLQATL